MKYCELDQNETKTKLDGNSREACCLLCTGVNGILVENSSSLRLPDVNCVFRLIRVGVSPWTLRPFMTGDVNGSSDLRSVPSGLSHARRVHRESRALHGAPMTWDLQLEASRTVGNGLWRHARVLEERKVISLGSAGFHLSDVPTF